MFRNKSLKALSLITAALTLTGCGSKTSASTKDTTSGSSKRMNIVCTIFPEYDWVKEIMGDHAADADITYLLDSGTDLHNYQPTAEDMLKISTCDLFIHVGGESDKWAEDALSGAVNKDMKVVDLMELLGDKAKVEELKEGMQDDEHEHCHEHNTDFEEDDVKDRTLSEWNGSWQSTYPLLLDGSLDEVWEHKAEDDDTMTAEDYKKKYTTAYETDVVTINIKAPEVEYVTDKKSIKAEYDYSGYYIRTKDDGSKQVRYKFEKKSGDDEATKNIVFSDHNIEPSEPEHFHIYSGNDGFDALVEEGMHFPTYYPSSLSAEDIVSEMTGGHKEDKDKEHEHDHEDGEEEYDEHVWLSLRNAKLICTEIANILSETDPDNAADYKANLNDYTAKLDALDKEFSDITDSAKNKTLVFGDRFPFRYLVDDYGIDYYAAFIGCSAESEASFETISFLAGKLKELECSTIFTIENSDKSIAEAIIKNSGIKNCDIAELNSVQSVSSNDIKSGVTYLSLMQQNCEVLKKYFA